MATRAPGNLLPILAMVFGSIVVLLVNFALPALLDLPVDDVLTDGAILFQLVIVELPFVIMFAAGVRSKPPWITGIALTAGFWGWFAWKVFEFHANGGGGANIGAALIMMASPALIGLGCGVAGAFGKVPPE